jgi:hypothetical protein
MQVMIAFRGQRSWQCSAFSRSRLEVPVLVDRLDGPVELLAESLGEESLDRNVKLLAEDDGEAGIDVVLDVCQ